MANFKKALRRSGGKTPVKRRSNRGREPGGEKRDGNPPKTLFTGDPNEEIDFEADAAEGDLFVAENFGSHE